METRTPAENPRHNSILNGAGVGVLIFSLGYLLWRLMRTFTPEYPYLWSLCLLAEAANTFSFALLVFDTWDLAVPRPFADIGKRSVDVFVTTYDENLSIVEPTLEGCRGLTCPHTTYLLDDGRRPEMRALAERYGAVYLTREGNADAKAGNLNAALARTEGEFIVTLDADMVPQPDMIENSLGYFVDPKVAVVQNTQEFYNLDSAIHFPSRWGYNGVAGEHWFSNKTLLPGRNRLNGSFWCGTPSILRRSALNEAGGVCAATRVEDYHTSVRLLSLGWKIIATDKAFAFGIAPQDLEAFLIQRARWSEGTTRVLTLPENPLVVPGLSFRQRLSLFAGPYYYLLTIVQLFWWALPFLLGAGGRIPLRAPFPVFAALWLPFFYGQLWFVTLKSKRQYSFNAFGLLSVFYMFQLPWSCVQGLLPFRLPFRVTPKDTEPSKARARTARLLAPQLIFFVFLLSIAVVAAAKLPSQFAAGGGGYSLFGAAWLWFAVVLFLTAFDKALRRGHAHRTYRFPVRLPFRWTSPGEGSGVTQEASARGLGFSTDREVKAGSKVSLELTTPEGTVKASGTVAWAGEASEAGRWDGGLEFDENGFDAASRGLWLRLLYVKLPPLWPTPSKPASFSL